MRHEEDSLTMVSYNRLHFGRQDEPRHTEQVGLLQAIDADVLAVQEFWDSSPGHWSLRPRFERFAHAVGRSGRVAQARRTHFHLGLLWRDGIGLRGWHAYEDGLWHGLGVAELDVRGVTVRVGVGHLNPFDPEYRLAEARLVAGLGLADATRATILAADWNTIGEDLAYDPEPDWSALAPDRLPRHLRWQDDPTAPPSADRRASALLSRAGLHDAARAIGASWQPTSGLEDAPRRIDAFRVSAPVLPALAGYEVIDTAVTRRLSDHLPIVLRLDLDRLRAATERAHRRDDGA